MSRMSLPAVRHPDDRPIATIRALVAFARERKRWPDAGELHRHRPRRTRLGSLRTVLRSLEFLRDQHLVEYRGHQHTARWVPTPLGFEVARIAPYAPPGERGPGLADVARILATVAEAPRIQEPAPIVLRANDLGFSTRLDIAE
jgi:hypothetical protein